MNYAIGQQVRSNEFAPKTKNNPLNIFGLLMPARAGI